eukprot:7812739-Pyramimonas_sp.AAC.2
MLLPHVLPHVGPVPACRSWSAWRAAREGPPPPPARPESPAPVQRTPPPQYGEPRPILCCPVSLPAGGVYKSRSPHEVDQQD